MPLDSRTSDTLTFTQDTPEHDQAILSLTDRAFGPGRYVKTAERLREGRTPLRDLSFVATMGMRLVGSVRLWAIDVADEATATRETLAFLGPIVVDSDYRNLGIGRQLIARSLEAAAQKGLKAVLLVGDAAYFTAFGFERAQGIALPGPVDPRRLLIRYLQDGQTIAGEVSVPQNRQAA